MMPSTLTPPHTYAQWATVLEDFKNKTDDEAVLAAMQAGTVEWQTGVAERFTQRLVDAVNTRMNRATDHFQQELSRARGEERLLVMALLALRRELAFLARAIALPALPEKDREAYRKLVLEQADRIQKSLEDSAKQDRTGRLSSILRNNRVNAI